MGSNRLGSGGGKARSVDYSFSANSDYTRGSQKISSQKRTVIVISDYEIRLNRFHVDSTRGNSSSCGSDNSLHSPQSSLTHSVL